MRHGKDKFFSTRGIHIAVNYWQKNGHNVICFLPDYLFDYEQVAANKKIMEMQLNKTVKASKLPDDVGMLHKMLEKGILIKTPS